MEVDNPGLTTTKVDTDITFHGKPSELPRLWFHVDMKALLDATLSTESRKSAYVAALFRGNAADWLARQYQQNPSILDDFQEFKDLVNETWGYSEETLQLIQERELVRLSARLGGVQDFTAQFEVLSSALQLNEATKKLLYSAKLPRELQDRVLVGQEPANYAEIKEEAKRIDDTLKAIGGPAGSTPETGKSPGKNRKQKRRAKASAPTLKVEKVNMISVRGVTPSARPNDRLIEIHIGGGRMHALLDSGSAVNCVKFPPANGCRQLYDSHVTLTGPTGEVIADRPQYYIDAIDDIPHHFYVIPNLHEDAILGRPYLDHVRPMDVFSVDLVGEIPASGRMRPLSLPEERAMEEFLAEGLPRNWVRPSTSEKPANPLFVPKKNKSLRLCIDFRPVNSVTTTDKYPIPHLWDLLQRAMKGKWFSVLDGKHAFHRLRVRPGDEWKLAFKTHRGVFEWLVMPFGVTNGPAYQQRWMDHVLREHESYAACYIDDIIIWAGEYEELLANEWKVLDTLDAHQIPVNHDKDQHALEQVNFLGMKLAHGRLDANMDEPLIKDWPRPRTKKELQQFIGLANWFGYVTYPLSEAMAPLYPLTGNTSFQWNDEHEKAFAYTKDVLLSRMTIFQFSADKDLVIYCDASQFATGAVAMQGNDTIAVTGSTLDVHQRNYTTTERELLAVVRAVKKWRYFIESCLGEIVICTDHKAITQDLNKSHENRRMNRWMMFLGEFHLDYRYVPGTENPADIPSRRPDWVDQVSMEEKKGGGELPGKNYK